MQVKEMHKGICGSTFAVVHLLVDNVCLASVSNTFGFDGNSGK